MERCREILCAVQVKIFVRAQQETVAGDGDDRVNPMPRLAPSLDPNHLPCDIAAIERVERGIDVIELDLTTFQELYR